MRTTSLKTFADQLDKQIRGKGLRVISIESPKPKGDILITLKDKETTSFFTLTLYASGEWGKIEPHKDQI